MSCSGPRKGVENGLTENDTAVPDDEAGEGDDDWNIPDHRADNRHRVG